MDESRSALEVEREQWRFGSLPATSWSLVSTRLLLSGRELEIIQGVLSDMSEVEIAAHLGMSPHTVRTHFKRLYRKLNVNSRVALVMAIFRAAMAEGAGDASVITGC